MKFTVIFTLLALLFVDFAYVIRTKKIKMKEFTNHVFSSAVFCILLQFFMLLWGCFILRMVMGANFLSIFHFSVIKGVFFVFAFFTFIMTLYSACEFLENKKIK